MDAGGVTAVGRSCLVRRVRGRLAALTLHNGLRLAVDGRLMFETDGAGQVAIAISDDEIVVTCQLYGHTKIALGVPARPARVLADGKEIAFDYDAEGRCVRLPLPRIREVRIRLS